MGFNGCVHATWSDDGRNMTLDRLLAYTDKNGKTWPAPAGSVVNGASIPRVLWHLIGSPFCGRYRRASVIHDVYYTTRTELREAVDRVFLEMMAADKVAWIKRRAMYLAVRIFSPRWKGRRDG